jgi:hypothetical protein
MVFKSGTSGNPGGTRRTKPFYEALRLQIAAAGGDQKALRRVAQALIDRAATGDVAAISALADRLDGKVPLPTGGSDELGPTRLHISWKGNERAQDALTVASPVLISPPDEEL